MAEAWPINFVRRETLGEGAEGRVSLYENRVTGTLLAVKQPVFPKNAKHEQGLRATLLSEIKSMHIVGSHPNIVEMVAADEGSNLAILYKYCELGDANDLQNKFLDHNHKVPEITIWKFMLDMSRAMDHLHNGLAVPYVHGDLKPGNIMVTSERSASGILDFTPDFKLGDFSHLTPFTNSGPVVKFNGTPEYAPPFAEQSIRLAPPADIYSIGASIQQMTLTQLPTQTYKDFIHDRRLQGKVAPTEKEIDSNYNLWRWKIPVVYRPLNVGMTEQYQKWGVKEPRRPMSDALNDWYEMFLDADPKRRVTAKNLVKWFAPQAEEKMNIIRAADALEGALEDTQLVKEAIEARRTERAIKRQNRMRRMKPSPAYIID
jgi:serine/threonine protein kinase